MLEGWAIVDNTTGEDWTKVQLSLVSGRPISFVSQLYAPKYVDSSRQPNWPTIRRRRPVVHAGAFEELDKKAAGGWRRRQQPRREWPHDAAPTDGCGSPDDAR